MNRVFRNVNGPCFDEGISLEMECMVYEVAHEVARMKLKMAFFSSDWALAMQVPRHTKDNACRMPPMSFKSSCNDKGSSKRITLEPFGRRLKCHYGW